MDTAPRKQHSASDIDLRHPLEVDPLADSWTIEVPAEKREQVIERFGDLLAPGEGSAKTEDRLRAAVWLTFAQPRPIEERDALTPFDCGVDELNQCARRTRAPGPPAR